MDIIGQNGNDGEHYEEHRLNKKLESLEEELKSLPKTKNGNFIGQEVRREKILKEIKKLKEIIK